MKSCSQAGQDKWVLERMDNKRHGSYLEIGAWEPVLGNNTCLLQSDFKWWGLNIDRDPSFIPRWNKANRNIVIMDALKVNWLELLEGNTQIDYLSLDIDEDQMRFIELFPWDKVRFRLMTVEHDDYRFPGRRDAIRKILVNAGYNLDVADVRAWNGKAMGPPFEDWWISARN